MYSISLFWTVDVGQLVPKIYSVGSVDYRVIGNGHVIGLTVDVDSSAARRRHSDQVDLGEVVAQYIDVCPGYYVLDVHAVVSVGHIVVLDQKVVVEPGRIDAVSSVR